MADLHDRLERAATRDRRARARRQSDPFNWVRFDLVRWGAWAARQREGGHGWPATSPMFRLYRPPPGGNSDPLPPADVVDPAHMERLTVLVDQLTEEDRLRTICIARYRDQWPWRRISDHVACTEDALRHRLLRIHRSIGEQMADERSLTEHCATR